MESTQEGDGSWLRGPGTQRPHSRELVRDGPGQRGLHTLVLQQTPRGCEMHGGPSVH